MVNVGEKSSYNKSNLWSYISVADIPGENGKVLLFLHGGEEMLSRHSTGGIFFVGDSAGVIFSADICAKTEKRPKSIVMVSPPAGFKQNQSYLNQNLILVVLKRWYLIKFIKYHFFY